MTDEISISAIPARRISAVQGETSDIVEMALAADHMDDETVMFLSSRQEYPEVINLLVPIVRRRHTTGQAIVEALYENLTPPIKLNRIAAGVGLLRHYDGGRRKLQGTEQVGFLTSELVHELATGSTANAEAAQLVLTLLSQPITVLSEMSRTCRAGYLLARIVEARRNELR